MYVMEDFSVIGNIKIVKKKFFEICKLLRFFRNFIGLNEYFV